MNFFKYKNNKFFVDNVSVEKIAKKYATPFYCYSLSQINDNLENFQNSFKNINNMICFSVKSNSNVKILNELKKRGCGADVVSIGELLAALKSGISPKKIVFSGVGKTEKELEFAIKKNILLINIESESEADLINKISSTLSKKTSVGIRLNPNIKPKTIKKILTGSDNDKFGLTEKNFMKLYKKLKNSKNLSLDCLSVHIGSQILQTKPFKKLIDLLNSIIKKTQYNFKYIDLGGGIGISYKPNEKKFNYKEYSKIVEYFSKHHNCKIIFEPGRALLGNSAILVTKIIYIKKTAKKNFVILDAGMNDFIRPALYNTEHQIMPTKKNQNIYIKKNTDFVGPICESSDKFLNTTKFQKINEKDVLIISDVGAYGMSLASNYNLRPKPMELLVRKNKCQIIRKRENLIKLINE